MFILHLSKYISRYTLIHLELTFVRPRYFLEGDRPSQTNYHILLFCSILVLLKIKYGLSLYAIKAPTYYYI